MAAIRCRGSSGDCDCEKFVPYSYAKEQSKHRDKLRRFAFVLLDGEAFMNEEKNARVSGSDGSGHYVVAAGACACVVVSVAAWSVTANTNFLGVAAAIAGGFVGFVYAVQKRRLVRKR